MYWIFSYSGRDIAPPSCHPSSWKACEEKLPLKTQLKKLFSTSAFSIFTSLPVSFIRRAHLLWHSSSGLHTCRSPSCYSLPSTEPYINSLPFPGHLFSACAFAAFPSVWPAVPYSGLLPSLPNFLVLGIVMTCTLWKESLNICQLQFTPLSLKAISQGTQLTCPKTARSLLS